jgi:hypothetical protein
VEARKRQLGERHQVLSQKTIKKAAKNRQKELQAAKKITGTTNVPVPPNVEYYPPQFFDTITAIMLILVDANGCEKFKILDCTLEEIIAIRTEIYIALSTESGEILVPEFVL